VAPEDVLLRSRSASAGLERPNLEDFYTNCPSTTLSENRQGEDGWAVAFWEASVLVSPALPFTTARRLGQFPSSCMLINNVKQGSKVDLGLWRQDKGSRPLFDCERLALLQQRVTPSGGESSISASRNETVVLSTAVAVIRVRRSDPSVRRWIRGARIGDKDSVGCEAVDDA